MKKKKNISSTNIFIEILIILVCVAGIAGSLFLFRNLMFKSLAGKNDIPVGTITFKKKSPRRRLQHENVWEYLSLKSTVYQGDYILTEDDSEAQLFFSNDENIFSGSTDIHPNSIVRLSNQENILHFISGSISVNTGKTDKKTAIQTGDKLFVLDNNSSAIISMSNGNDSNLAATIFVSAGNVYQIPASETRGKITIPENLADREKISQGEVSTVTIDKKSIENLEQTSLISLPSDLKISAPKPENQNIEKTPVANNKFAVLMPPETYSITQDKNTKENIPFVWTGSNFVTVEFSYNKNFTTLASTSKLSSTNGTASIQIDYANPEETIFWKAYPDSDKTLAITGKIIVNNPADKNSREALEKVYDKKTAASIIEQAENAQKVIQESKNQVFEKLETVKTEKTVDHSDDSKNKTILDSNIEEKTEKMSITEKMQSLHSGKIEEEIKADEQRRIEAIAAENKRIEEERILAEEKRKADEAKKLAEEKRKADEAKKLAEEKRKADEAKKLAEEKRKADEAKKLAEEKRKADEAKKLAEEKRKADEAKKLAEEKRKTDEAKKLAEEKRKADEAKKLAEEKRKADEAKKLAEEKRKADEAKKLAEEKERLQREAAELAEKQRQEELRLAAEQAAIAEKQRLEAEQKALEEKKAAEIAEQKRLAEEKRKADEERKQAEAKATEERKAKEAAELAEKQRLEREAAKKVAEEEKKKALTAKLAEKRRLAEEKAAQEMAEAKAAEERKAKEAAELAEKQRLERETAEAAKKAAEEERKQEKAKKLEEKRKLTQEKAKQELEAVAAEEQRRIVEEAAARKAAEEAEKAKLEAERKQKEAAELAEKQRLEQEAAEAARKAAEEAKALAEKQRLEREAAEAEERAFQNAEQIKTFKNTEIILFTPDADKTFTENDFDDDNPKIEFSWKAVPFAKGYVFEIKNYFGKTLLSKTVKNNSYTLSDEIEVVADDGNYYWCVFAVRKINDEEVQTLTSKRSFKVNLGSLESAILDMTNFVSD